MPNGSPVNGLDALEASIRHGLQQMTWPGKEWVMERPAPDASSAHVYDVVIVGGGQCGLAAAFGLMREKVMNVICLDENEEGKEGPWITYARMKTLRTPKHLTGLEYGMPELTFQAFYEAQYGAKAWEDLGKIPKEMWMEYLRFYRRALCIPVANGIKVTSIEPLDRDSPDAGFRLSVLRGGEPETMFARKVVLATGIQGGGEWHVPPFIRAAVPKKFYAHTSEIIDFGDLKGKRVAILGGGASAFDNAQHVLGAAAGEVHVFVRRQELPRINPIRFMEFSGFLKHFSDLDDATKYAGIDFFLGFNQPPTNDTFARAASYPNFTLHTGSEWKELSMNEDGSRVHITSAKGDEGEFDFLVVSTGMLTSPSLRQELKAVEGDIARWADKFTAPTGMKRNQLIDDHPYLGPNFQFMPKAAGTAPYLCGLYNFNYAALPSLGLSASALSGCKFALPKLIDGITRSLFLEDSPKILERYFAYNDVEFVGSWPLDEMTRRESVDKIHAENCVLALPPLTPTMSSEPAI